MTSGNSHLPVGYDYERCALCAGRGTTNQDAVCPPCNGTGRILVHQPPISCGRCKGTGKPLKGDAYGLHVCVVCRGSGWAMAVLG